MSAKTTAKKPASPKRIRYQDTSAEAWREWQKIASATLDGKIVGALWGTKGLMCWEIEEIVEATHQAVSGNLRHLVKKGYVVDTGRRGATPRGRGAIVWALAKKRVAKPARKVRGA